MCDDGWDDTDAGVVCRQLGFGSSGTAIGSAGFGQGSGSILLDNVSCTGNESTLASCGHLGLGVIRSCGHYEDAGVRCSDAGKLTLMYVHMANDYCLAVVRCDIMNVKSLKGYCTEKSLITDMTRKLIHCRSPKSEEATNRFWQEIIDKSLISTFGSLYYIRIYLISLSPFLVSHVRRDSSLRNT